MKLPLRREYQNLNKILIKKSALEHNFKVLQKYHPEAKICPVVKSNAYGHGLITVAPIFDSLNPAFLVVDSLYEAYELYKLKIKSPILILGYTHPDNFKVKRLPFHFSVFDLTTAEVLNRYQPNCSIHLFVDTGMCREGISLKELPTFIKEIKKLKHLNIVGLASHFADADNPNDQLFSQLQLNNYKTALKILEENDIHPQWKHISASGGAFKTIDPVFTMIRVGLAMYGIHPLEPTDDSYRRIELQPALRFVSTLAQIKEISKGDKVGYNGTFEAKKTMRIGFIPAGYYEGIDRRLSNNGVFKVADQYCPILGRVSMNMTTIDLTTVPQAKVGGEVEIYSPNEEDKNGFLNVAKIAGTIPYEILVPIAEPVKRVVE